MINHSTKKYSPSNCNESIHRYIHMYQQCLNEERNKEFFERCFYKEESLFKEEHKSTRGNDYPSLSVYSSISLYSMFLPVSYILRNIDMRMNERVLNRSIQYLHILLGINKDIFKESNVLTFDEYILWKSFIEVYSLMYI